MVCPYRKSIHIVETNYEKDDTTTKTYREDYMYESCAKEECGAWHDGKCNYRSEKV